MLVFASPRLTLNAKKTSHRQRQRCQPQRREKCDTALHGLGATRQHVS